MAALSIITMGICLTTVWGGLVYHLARLVKNETKTTVKTAQRMPWRCSVDKEIKNVKAVLKSNVYFGGKVISRTFYKENGDRFTLGVITPGTYKFDVGDKEIVRLISGTAEICLPGDANFHQVSEGETFIVPSETDYDIRTYDVVEYLCDYVTE